MSAKELKKRQALNEQDFETACLTNQKFKEQRERERRLLLAAVDLAGQVTREEEIKK